jgi:hypothetical protein
MDSPMAYGKSYYLFPYSVALLSLLACWVASIDGLLSLLLCFQYTIWHYQQCFELTGQQILLLIADLCSALLSAALAKIDHTKIFISRVGYQVELVSARLFTSFFCFFFFVCLSCCIAGRFGRSLARNHGNMAPNGGCGLGCIIRRMRTIASSKEQEHATAFFTHCSAPLVVYAVHLNGIEEGDPTGGRDTGYIP